jgi:predicted transcriptional regulator
MQYAYRNVLKRVKEMTKIFIVRLSKPLRAAQEAPETKTVYKLAQKTGVTFNTIKKYIAGDVTTPVLSGEVLKLCEYFGLDWHDLSIVEPIEVSEEDIEGKLKTVLAPV